MLKLGFEVAQSSVAKYTVKRRGPPSQGWRTFLRNHAPDIAAMDLFVVPTLGFDLLYAFVIVRLDRRLGVGNRAYGEGGPRSRRTYKRLRTDDRENVQDRRKPSIQLDQKPAIAVR